MRTIRDDYAALDFGFAGYWLYGLIHGRDPWWMCVVVVVVFASFGVMQLRLAHTEYMLSRVRHITDRVMRESGEERDV